MRESSTYQAILAEGMVQGAVAEAKKLLRLFGDDSFGPPDPRTAAHLERLTDLTHLEELFTRVPTVTSWQELLGQPAPGRRRRREQSP